MQVTVVKQQEFHVPSGLDWIGSKHTHVIGWQEDATTFDYWTELFHPECARVVKRQWEKGRLTIHTNYSHETHGVQIWEGMDPLIAYSSRRTPDVQPKYLYVNQNYNDRWHRRELIEQLRKRRLLGAGRISWGADVPVEGVRLERLWRQAEPPEQYVHTNDESDMPPPPVDVWSECAFNLVSEAHHNDPGHPFSEKIFQAIWQRRPVLVNGAPGVHKRLKDLGYRLMLDIDYEFDSVEDPVERIALLADQVAQLRGRHLSVAKRNRKVVEHNYRQLVASVQSNPPPDIVHLPNQSPGAASLIEYVHRVRNAVDEL